MTTRKYAIPLTGTATIGSADGCDVVIQDPSMPALCGTFRRAADGSVDIVPASDSRWYELLGQSGLVHAPHQLEPGDTVKLAACSLRVRAICTDVEGQHALQRVDTPTPGSKYVTAYNDSPPLVRCCCGGECSNTDCTGIRQTDTSPLPVFNPSLPLAPTAALLTTRPCATFATMKPMKMTTS